MILEDDMFLFNNKNSAVRAFLILITFALPGMSQTLSWGGETELFSGTEQDTLTIHVSEIQLVPVEIEGATYAIPQIPNANYLMDKGRPSIPFINGSYLLKDTDRIILKIRTVKTREINLETLGYAGVVPSKGALERNIDPAKVLWTFDPKIYDTETVFPERDVELEHPFITGPLRGQNLRIPLIHWDTATNTLIVIENMTLDIIHQEDSVNPRRNTTKHLSGMFNEMQQRFFLNVPRETPDYAPMVEAGRVLLITYDTFAEENQPLIDWETQVGYPVELTLLSAIPHAGSSPTAQEIKTYIQSIYDEPQGLSWIILVGDYNEIPNLNGVFSQHAPCDACYTQLEGSDQHPDCAISRISAQTETDVTVQVGKFLDYEQNPSTGSASAWYSKAFGIAGDDSGGTPSYQDWERMDFLKDILVSPNFHYNEFTEIYHGSASVTQVMNAVDDGRGLGLYIGHGGETYWVTTGFAVTDVNDLANNEMLPVVWDVACVNGAFHRSGGDCFSESWLKKAGGGAISFEAATTNESWVPPCDAQRGILDAFRFGWAFTTGGQHFYGKETCFGINGDTPGSEGNKFMEQSTLFGNCLLWPRTKEPVIPDEPVDFISAGGVASLTVKVAGNALNQANSAIVNFYTKSGSTITQCGSGLINSSGVVTAQITGTPTHCHIHGMNLVPTEFELSARPLGTVSFNATAYACNATVTVKVSDSNIPGTSPATIDQITVNVKNGATVFPLTLTENLPDSNMFNAAFILGTDLTGVHGDTLTVEYTDADDGAGNLNQLRTDSSSLDCQGPVITDVQTVATEQTITIQFNTDEPGTSTIRYGTSTPLTELLEEASLVQGQHSVVLTGLTPCTRYYVEVESTDHFGNTGQEPAGDIPHQVDTNGWAAFMDEPMDTDPNWTISNGTNSNGWAFGVPTGQGGATGEADPTAGYTGDNVYGVNLSGDYDSGLSLDELTLTTPEVNISEGNTLFLRYRRWLGVESSSYDHARVQVSIDGGAFQTIWENGASMSDGAWVEMNHDLTSIAAGHDTIQVRWTMGSSDGSVVYCGWNLDDVFLEGAVPCTIQDPDHIFKAEFETGDCSEWDALYSE
jgi:hypothetical protein